MEKVIFIQFIKHWSWHAIKGQNTISTLLYGRVHKWWMIEQVHIVGLDGTFLNSSTGVSSRDAYFTCRHSHAWQLSGTDFRRTSTVRRMFWHQCNVFSQFPRRWLLRPNTSGLRLSEAKFKIAWIIFGRCRATDVFAHTVIWFTFELFILLQSIRTVTDASFCISISRRL